jgi:peptidoglycan hydrolase-like protein with peptidoglycan-binding domain
MINTDESYLQRGLVMLFPIITFIVAISIAVIAAWFSIAGLMAIFSAAAIPVALMAGSLEVGKLVSASWVYRNWKRAPFLLKSYLTAATVVLMFITSMGIFGYLSKAHLEQSAQMTQGSAQVEQFTAEITSKEQEIALLMQKATELRSQATNNTASIQAQIDAEQKRKDEAYARIQPAIDEQNAIIAKEQGGSSPEVQTYQRRIDQIDAELAQLQTYIEQNNIAQLQAMVGVKADGNYGSQTTAAVESFKQQKSSEKNALLDSIAKAQTNADQTKIDAARAEITRLRSLAEQEVAASQSTIDSLRQQLTTVSTIDNSAEVQKVQTQIDAENEELKKMKDEKFALETEIRKLEAEVGPIKYIAELVYGNTDKSTIDVAVRWLIIVFIFVFDPLAVLLLIAANFSWKHRHDDDGAQEEIFEAIFSRSNDEPKVEKSLDNQEVMSDNKPTDEEIQEQEIVTESENVDNEPTADEKSYTVINKLEATPEPTIIKTPRKPSGWLDYIRK